MVSERSVFEENAGSEPFTRHGGCVTAKVDLLYNCFLAFLYTFGENNLLNM